jgi:quercetin dioxygenase-like cupin family protein
MIIKNYKEQEIKQNPHGVDLRKLYDKESAQVMHLTLKPGESLKPHKTPVDVFFYILEGTPTVQVGTELVICEKDQLIESPANIVHNLSNDTNNIARIMVVKAPKPTKKSIIL